ncbi:hypothetical protein [uncultured Draconibacterium sp.]|uniref:hypothetical protein n=1 Tax=uncultured Draconibacterium sp. TaxID=1573823 RepID=UPI0025F7608B|nr:hypothetical protein [uncultured Draconibacterium sp.]
MSYLYQGTIERLVHGGYFSPEQGDHILFELSKLQRIKNQVTAMAEERLQYFCDRLLSELKSGNCPMIPMALSMIFYNLTQMGADTQRLRDFLDECEELQQVIEKTINAG